MKKFLLSQILVYTIVLMISGIYGQGKIGHLQNQLLLQNDSKIVVPQMDLQGLLYDQTSGTIGASYTSQDFETVNDAYDAQIADDFTASGTWTIYQVVVAGTYSAFGPAAGFNIYFYSNNAGVPGTQVYSGLSQAYTYNGAGIFVITLTTPATLSAGNYWVSVQCRMDYGTGGQWYWSSLSGTHGLVAQFQNPGNGFATGCITWSPITTCLTATNTDMYFAFTGTSTPGPGPATNPTPTNGAINIPISGSSLHWTNPGGVTGVQVFFGTAVGNLSSVYSGVPVTSYSLSTLNYSTYYYWQIYETNAAGTTQGYIWSFKTEASPCGVTTAPWTEDFELAAVPPLCWSLNGTANLWGLGAASGYGTGAYSAYANFYGVSTGTQDLITFQFDASAMTSPTLKFDWAYSTYSGEVDEMDIYYSTNAGTNWTLLLAMPGGTNGILNPFHLVNTSPYVPAAGEWSTQSLTLPAGTNKVKFTAITAYGNDLFVDNVKVVQTLANDVGTYSIDIPASINPGVMAPKATFKNFGSATNTFNVRMNITGGYTSTKTVTSLAPGATQQVTFDNWNPSLGQYTAQVFTQLGTDGNHANDTLYKNIGAYTGSWTSGSAFSTTTYLGGGVGVNGYIYSIGGNTTSALGTECYKYNVATDTWTAIASLPAGRRVFAIAANGSQIFVIGGSDMSSVYQSTVYKYDIGTDTWSTVAPLPVAMAWGKATNFNNKIYFAGGVDASSIVSSAVYVYDITGNTWSTATAMPTPIFGGAFSNVGNKLIYVAGADLSNIYNTVMVGTIDGGNPLLISWTTMSNPYPGTGAKSFATQSGRTTDLIPDLENNPVDNAVFPAGTMYRFDAAPWGTDGIIVANGSPNANWIPAVPNPNYIYKPSTDTWVKQGDVPIPVLGASLGTVNNGDTWKLVIASGLSSAGATNATQIWTDNLGTTTFPLSVDITGGWNMVSVPGTNPDGMDITHWWINHTGTVYKFVPGSGYTGITTTTPGLGYWMKNTITQTYNTGDEWPAGGIQFVVHNPINASIGWNMFGGYEDIISTTALTTTPPGQIVFPIYKFVPGTGYQSANQIVPGYGYWVKVSSACQINIPNVMAKDNPAAIEYFKNDWGRITITDATGSSYTLYGVTGGVDLNQYELPPLPPSGIFDIRYGSGRVAENLGTTQSIEMRGITYPVRVKVENIDITLQDETGTIVKSSLKSGEEIVISNPSVNKLMLTGTTIPSEYSLDQNYPNPFNPTTTIKFSIPEAANVTLNIYNMLGQKVGELVNGKLEAGRYNYQWNAKNVATGMYIYELRTEKFVSVKKMLLLK